MSKKYKMHVISGTHWDREWRHTPEQSKPRLVELVDGMIKTLDTAPDYKTFCLDGGSVVLEDYLSVKPENRDKLTELIKAGRVSLANWYTLPEMFTVAAESIIRNIKLGQDMAAEFGGTMSSGYTATGYGQTSQLPQIYQGFDITNAIFYRGTNKYLLDPLFLWEGADGSKLHMLRTHDEVTRTNWYFYVHQPLAVGKSPIDPLYHYNREELPIHMCDSQLYTRAFKLTKEFYDFKNDEESLKTALNTILEQAKPYMVGSHILALNMEDNDVPYAQLPEMIDALNKVSPDVEIVQSSMDEYMDAITSEKKESELRLHHGELRYPAVEFGFNCLLAAMHSSRMKLKILNEESETCLLHQAEPIASFSTLLGDEYPRAFLDRAWKRLLLNHAHDSICGAAVDQAHRDMLYNFSTAKLVSEEVTARSIEKIYKKLNLADDFKDGDHTITLFNTLPFGRKLVTELVIDLPEKGGTGNAIDPCIGLGEGKYEIEYFDIVDSDGNELDYEILSTEEIKIHVETDLDTAGITLPTVRRRILLDTEIPAMGYKTVALRPRGPKFMPHPAELGHDRALIARDSGVLENENLKVKINSNGTFSLLHKPTGHLMENMHYFTDTGETGSAHMSKQPQRNTTQTSLGAVANITMLESNQLRGAYRIDLNLTVPAAATLDEKDRLREVKTIPVTTWLTLEKGSKMLKMKTRLTNEARDHKLKVNFPSYVKSDYSWAESAFAVDKRPIQWTESGDNFEGFFPYQPMQNFVDISDDKLGLAVLNKGLREYEISDDTDRTIAITLLRTQRAYMTANSVMTPEEFDQHTGQHSIGTLECHYALCPHTNDWCKGGVLQAAYDHKVAVNAIQGVPHSEGSLPSSSSLLTILPADKLMVSAMKQADDGSGIIVRLWNISDENLDATVKTSAEIKSVEMLKLNETCLGELALENGTVKFDCGPHKIVTLLLKTK
ncbi:MAG: glycoside hydrolase family 38 C-terminal domain-containing protein [Planctomycetota bacterium]